MKVRSTFLSLAFLGLGSLQAQSKVSWPQLPVNVIEDFRNKTALYTANLKHVPIVVSSGHDEGKEN